MVLINHKDNPEYRPRIPIKDNSCAKIITDFTKKEEQLWESLKKEAEGE